MIETLGEARERRPEFDRIVLVQPVGREGPFFHYDSLGLGNLITAYIGGLMVDSEMPIIGFHAVRITSFWRLVSRNSFQWFTRSSFRTSRLSWENSKLRRQIAPPISEHSWIDKSARILFLSAGLANFDNAYFAGFNCLDRSIVRSRLWESFRVRIPQFDDSSVRMGTLGVHIRQGDFAQLKPSDNSVLPNRRLPVAWFVEATRQIIEANKATMVILYSDNRLGFPTESFETLEGFELKRYPIFRDGTATINHMLRCEHMLVSNSTLSFWAALLSGRETFYLPEGAAYKNQMKYLPNFNQITATS